MSTCSVCNKDFEDEYFDVEQNKCILHCEKHEKNYWFAINKNNKIEWQKDILSCFIQKNKLLRNLEKKSNSNNGYFFIFFSNFGKKLIMKLKL